MKGCVVIISNKLKNFDDVMMSNVAVNPYSLYLDIKHKMTYWDKEKKSKPPKFKKKKKVSLPVLDDYEYNPTVVDVQNYVDFNHVVEREGNDVPECMLLDIRYDSGFVFGLKRMYGVNKYVGMRQGEEGNILVVGGNGSGKSVGNVKPTLQG